ncbi:MAG: LamG domain-containing protein [Bacteroidales bacterium]|nr:LamG domain-containing protein [Bacteroidales bacterium]
MALWKKNLLSGFLSLLWCTLPAQSLIDWKVAELPHVQKTEGNPRQVATVLGFAVAFGGRDAFFLDVNPLKGLERFTLEAVFKPDGDGEFAQRFLHLGTVSNERVMFEIRVNPDRTWYFDTHIALSGGGRLTMINEKLTHSTDRWYHAALVIDGERATVYIDGVAEFNEPLAFIPVNEGIASVGVRQNLSSWFKGSMYRLRITPRALTKEEFLDDHQTLNR